MPSSSALVATTARICPRADCRSISRRSRGRYPPRYPRTVSLGNGPAVAGVFEIGDQHLGGQPVVGEHQRLQIALDELQRHAPRLVDVAAPDAELPVHHRRIVEDEELLPARRAVALHQLERLAGQRLGQLARVGDRGRAADELRLRSVEFADPRQPPQQVRQVAAVHAAVIVQLIDHDVAQVFEIPRPACV